MAIVFVHVARRSVAEYPKSYKTEIEDIIRRWRPDVWARSQETV